MIAILIDCFFFKQKTAYVMRMSDWSSDVCSSDLVEPFDAAAVQRRAQRVRHVVRYRRVGALAPGNGEAAGDPVAVAPRQRAGQRGAVARAPALVVQCERAFLDRKSTRLNSSH